MEKGGGGSGPSLHNGGGGSGPSLHNYVEMNVHDRINEYASNKEYDFCEKCVTVEKITLFHRS